MNFFVTFPKLFNLTGGQTDRHTDRHTDRQTDRQTDEKSNDGSLIYKVFEDILAYFKIFLKMTYTTRQDKNMMLMGQ